MRSTWNDRGRLLAQNRRLWSFTDAKIKSNFKFLNLIGAEGCAHFFHVAGKCVSSLECTFMYGQT